MLKAGCTLKARFPLIRRRRQNVRADKRGNIDLISILRAGETSDQDAFLQHCIA